MTFQTPLPPSLGYEHRGKRGGFHPGDAEWAASIRGAWPRRTTSISGRPPPTGFPRRDEHGQRQRRSGGSRWRFGAGHDVPFPRHDQDADGTLTGVDITFTTPAFADSDGDGLPDDYETAHGLNRHNVADALIDRMATGRPTWPNTLRAPTRKSGRCFRMLGLHDGGADVTVRFTTVFGKHYVIDRALSNLTAPRDWAVVDSDAQWQRCAAVLHRCQRAREGQRPGAVLLPGADRVGP